MDIEFLVKSDSQDAPYIVKFIEQDGKIFIKCNCKAGRFGNFCKHKMRLIQGHDDILQNEDQARDLAKVERRIQKSEYLDLIIERSKARKKSEEAEKEIKAVNKKIGDAMKKGL